MREQDHAYLEFMNELEGKSRNDESWWWIEPYEKEEKEEGVIEDPLYASGGMMGQSVNGMMGQSVNGMMGQSVNGMMGQPVNPMMNQTINPMMGQSVNPMMNQTINPMMNQPINPILNQPINPPTQPPPQNTPIIRPGCISYAQPTQTYDQQTLMKNMRKFVWNA